jgi:hypothetical protein
MRLSHYRSKTDGFVIPHVEDSGNGCRTGGGFQPEPHCPEKAQYQNEAASAATPVPLSVMVIQLPRLPVFFHYADVN